MTGRMEPASYPSSVEEDFVMCWPITRRGLPDRRRSIERYAAGTGDNHPEFQSLKAGIQRHYVRLTARALTGRGFKVNKPDIWNTRPADRRRTSFE
jgi:hypothetical protein